VKGDENHYVLTSPIKKQQLAFIVIPAGVRIYKSRISLLYMPDWMFSGFPFFNAGMTVMKSFVLKKYQK